MQNITGLSRANIVTQQIREDIIRGDLIPDMALIESEMVLKYQVSRNTLREALHQLQSDGLTTYVRHKGVFVRRLEKTDIREIFQARRLLELNAIHALKKDKGELIQLLESDIDMARDAYQQENWQMVATMSLRFHQHLVSALNNRLISDFFQNILAQLRLVFALSSDEATFQRPWLQKDRQILDLLVTQKFDAAYEALELYLMESEKNILQLDQPTKY
ncbi:GntR family transcriptional regulator [Acinetobacter soli]|jgi:DNA-binding GntR family transcriptional regulator|uniref:GntR family transcriptional regulator n=1 Tax=Acinetobacter soli TaxID=487316 RepID=UPI0030160742